MDTCIIYDQYLLTTSPLLEWFPVGFSLMGKLFSTWSRNLLYCDTLAAFWLIFQLLHSLSKISQGLSIPKDLRPSSTEIDNILYSNPGILYNDSLQTLLLHAKWVLLKQCHNNINCYWNPITFSLTLSLNNRASTSTSHDCFQCLFIACSHTDIQIL